jgi:hypothetical protein
MTTGVLIFAFNNEHVDYVAMASWSAKNIHRHLDLPVCLVTDKPDHQFSESFDQVVVIDRTNTGHPRYFKDYKQVAIWHNTTRVNAYDLSPWDHTLVLDADYVVASDQLRLLFETNQDFLAHRWAHDMSGQLAFFDNNWFGMYRMPMSWATVMCFRRSKKAEMIFGSMQMIRDHWDHYRHLYQIGETVYRNDYSLSIAQNLVDGHALNSPHIPWSLATVTPETKLEQVDKDTYKITYETLESKNKWMFIQQDFHAMGKQALEHIIANNS